MVLSANPTHFLANSCQVCKKLHPSVVCEICGMVAYCTAEERRSHWPIHSHLCRAVYKICTAKGIRTLFEPAIDGTPEKYRSARHAAAMECSAFLGRKLESFELEMLYWPKVCGVCYKPGTSLTCCKGCEFVYTCSKLHFPKNHDKWCSKLKLYQDLIRRDDKEGEPLLEDIKINFNALNMTDALATDGSSSISVAMKSEILTYPLTTELGLNDLASTETITIHIVGAELDAEVFPISKWEFHLLHRLINCISLQLIFVGPDLKKTDLCNSVGEIELCDACRNAGKHLSYEMITETFYHDYTKLENFKPAQLITAFNSGLYRSIGFNGTDSWSPTLDEIFRRQKCLMLITEYTEFEIEQDLTLLKTRFSELSIKRGPEINPFSSLKPNLNIISDDVIPVIFKNYYYVLLSS